MSDWVTLNYLEESDETECRKRELFQMKTSADTVQDLDDIIGSEWEETGMGDRQNRQESVYKTRFNY